MQPVILFDMDGTLLDTEKYYVRNWQRAANEAGFAMTHQQALAMRSLDRERGRNLFVEWFGEAADCEAVRDLRQKYMTEDLAREGIHAKPTTAETLQILKAGGYRFAVVTASGPERADQYLTAAGIRQYFDTIICATMVKHGKPDPDIYLYACDQMGITPAEAIVVEDAPNGIKAAAAAGIKNIIMMEDQSPAAEEELPLICGRIQQLEQLLPMLKKL